jgi:signal transduction histidine kinase
LETELRQRLLQQAVAITLVMLIAAALMAYLKRRLLRPLRKLVAAAAAVARGERTHVGVEEADADLMALAGAMDSMSEAVSAREDALRDEARLVESLRQIGETLAAELDLEKLVQAATDAATEVTGAEFGAFFYNVVDDRGESYTLYTVSGIPRARFDGFPMPRITPIFTPTFHGDGAVRLDDVTADEHYGQNPPYHGMPPGHLPVQAYLAVPVVSRSGEVLGGLFFGHSTTGVFTERAERLASGIAAQAAVAIDNARLYRQAQDAIRMRDQFLSIASHELRTPLAGIKATAQAAQRAHARGALHDERLERSLATIASATDRVARLAGELLDVSRLRTGRMPMSWAVVDVHMMLDRLVATFQERWDQQHRLEFERGTEKATLVGDADRLEQVFVNLLENAAKYSPDGSLVRIASATDGWGLKVEITDQGIGVPSGTANLLFEPFGRAANAVERHIQGLGLGLYISRQIVESHAGRLWFESAGEGEGSTFVVWLPYERESADSNPL